ncbi:hypothetical protein IE077_002096 [Cardiosporidium cionae]|uniref:Uncharacterized protein n=1 Tax=Cardiosporidium cionae TaxID=476202 RepID=A0ABQ7J4Q6_9APIC|nr:hypothetical protein IE077_002096 [Cardiosporidium cionae]|eukprot:KAF8818381.1 hypothetical protein IE077_002096 [Cardiosporidium cionae]
MESNAWNHRSMYPPRRSFPGNGNTAPTNLNEGTLLRDVYSSSTLPGEGGGAAERAAYDTAMRTGHLLSSGYLPTAQGAQPPLSLQVTGTQPTRLLSQTNASDESIHAPLGFTPALYKKEEKRFSSTYEGSFLPSFGGAGRENASPAVPAQRLPYGSASHKTVSSTAITAEFRVEERKEGSSTEQGIRRSFYGSPTSVNIQRSMARSPRHSLSLASIANPSPPLYSSQHSSPSLATLYPPPPRILSVPHAVTHAHLSHALPPRTVRSQLPSRPSPSVGGTHPADILPSQPYPSSFSSFPSSVAHCSLGGGEPPKGRESGSNPTLSSYPRASLYPSSSMVQSHAVPFSSVERHGSIYPPYTVNRAPIPRAPPCHPSPAGAFPLLLGPVPPSSSQPLPVSASPPTPIGWVGGVALPRSSTPRAVAPLYTSSYPSMARLIPSSLGHTIDMHTFLPSGGSIPAMPMSTVVPPPPPPPPTDGGRLAGVEGGAPSVPTKEVPPAGWEAKKHVENEGEERLAGPSIGENSISVVVLHPLVNASGPISGKMDPRHDAKFYQPNQHMIRDFEHLILPPTNRTDTQLQSPLPEHVDAKTLCTKLDGAQLLWKTPLQRLSTLLLSPPVNMDDEPWIEGTTTLMALGLPRNITAEAITNVLVGLFIANKSSGWTESLCPAGWISPLDEDNVSLLSLSSFAYGDTQKEQNLYEDSEITGGPTTGGAIFPSAVLGGGAVARLSSLLRGGTADALSSTNPTATEGKMMGGRPPFSDPLSPIGSEGGTFSKAFSVPSLQSREAMGLEKVVMMFGDVSRGALNQLPLVYPRRVSLTGSGRGKETPQVISPAQSVTPYAMGSLFFSSEEAAQEFWISFSMNAAHVYGTTIKLCPDPSGLRVLAEGLACTFHGDTEREDEKGWASRPVGIRGEGMSCGIQHTLGETSPERPPASPSSLLSPLSAEDDRIVWSAPMDIALLERGLNRTPHACEYTLHPHCIEIRFKSTSDIETLCRYKKPMLSSQGDSLTAVMLLCNDRLLPAFIKHPSPLKPVAAPPPPLLSPAMTATLPQSIEKSINAVANAENIDSSTSSDEENEHSFSNSGSENSSNSSDSSDSDSSADGNESETSPQKDLQHTAPSPKRTQQGEQESSSKSTVKASFPRLVAHRNIYSTAKSGTSLPAPSSQRGITPSRACKEKTVHAARSSPLASGRVVQAATRGRGRGRPRRILPVDRKMAEPTGNSERGAAVALDSEETAVQPVAMAGDASLSEPLQPRIESSIDQAVAEDNGEMDVIPIETVPEHTATEEEAFSVRRHGHKAPKRTEPSSSMISMKPSETQVDIASEEANKKLKISEYDKGLMCDEAYRRRSLRLFGNGSTEVLVQLGVKGERGGRLQQSRVSSLSPKEDVAAEKKESESVGMEDSNAEMAAAVALVATQGVPEKSKKMQKEKKLYNTNVLAEAYLLEPPILRWDEFEERHFFNVSALHTASIPVVCRAPLIKAEKLKKVLKSSVKV